MTESVMATEDSTPMPQNPPVVRGQISAPIPPRLVLPTTSTPEQRRAQLAEALEGSKASTTLRDSVKKSLDTKIKESQSSANAKKRAATFDVVLDRYEAKYIIPRHLVAEIREYIRPFCEADPHTKGDPPEYVITTMQLDSPNLCLHHAKENDALHRFKLRVRTYGDFGTNKIYMEVKRKYRATIIKSRCAIPYEAWSSDLLFNRDISKIPFKSKKEQSGFLEFARLTREIGARPVVLIRYIREAYFGKMDHYARISFDRKLQYYPTTDWMDWGVGKKWFSMDTAVAQNKGYPFSGIVLELKTLSDTPQWMVDLVQEFDLVRVGNCKYSTALWCEAMFRGSPDTSESEMEYLQYL